MTQLTINTRSNPQNHNVLVLAYPNILNVCAHPGVELILCFLAVMEDAFKTLPCMA